MMNEALSHKDIYGDTSLISKQSNEIWPLSDEAAQDLFYKRIVTSICHIECRSCKHQHKNLSGREMILLNEGVPLYSTIISRLMKCTKCGRDILLMKKEDYGCFGPSQRVYWDSTQEKFVHVHEQNEPFVKAFDKLVQF